MLASLLVANHNVSDRPCGLPVVSGRLLAPLEAPAGGTCAVLQVWPPVIDEVGGEEDCVPRLNLMVATPLGPAKDGKNIREVVSPEGDAGHGA
jgi:hypothetical protein